MSLALRWLAGRRVLAGALAGGAVLLGSGCSKPAPKPAAQFDNQSGNDGIACMAHQSGRPDARYQGGSGANTSLILAMLHYYVVNGSKPYCDGQPATASDHAWLQDYLALGADPHNVQRHEPLPGTPAPRVSAS
ncbi:MAG: hypothetical protein NVSMB32_10790 [Actinomycetota bacterium]